MTAKLLDGLPHSRKDGILQLNDQCQSLLGKIDLALSPILAFDQRLHKPSPLQRQQRTTDARLTDADLRTQRTDRYRATLRKRHQKREMSRLYRRISMGKNLRHSILHTLS
jgi:hypothetical protein